MKTKTIGITATNFAGNKGAAAMLQSIIMNTVEDGVKYSLFSVYPESDIKQNPYDFLKVVSTKPEQLIFIAFPLAILFYLLKKIKFVKSFILKNNILMNLYKCDLIVDAAGITFVDSRGLIMNTYNFICIATPLLMGVKVIKFSQAMGPFQSFWNKRLGRMVLPKIDTICARGKITEAYLIDFGLNNVELCADGAFMMKDDEYATNYVDDIVDNDSFYEKRVVGLSISSVVEGYCHKNNIDYIGIMRRFVHYLNLEGYGVLIIANAARKGKTKPKNNDLIVCQKLYDSLDDQSLSRWYDDEFTPEVIRELISKMDMLVASRFHAMIGALEKEVPVLLIGWSHKYKEVLDMFEIGEYAIDYKKLNYKLLVKAFIQLEGNVEEIRSGIGSNLSSVKKSSYKNIEIIKKAMSEVI